MNGIEGGEPFGKNSPGSAFLALAQRYTRLMPGDFPSLALAQWALETGYGKDVPGRGDDLWREHGNPWCIKEARDNRFQDGVTHDGYAIYHTLEQAFKDRFRILAWYRARAEKEGILHTDILGLLDRWWAPSQTYKEEVTKIITQHRLYRWDPVPKL